MYVVLRLYSHPEWTATEGKQSSAFLDHEEAASGSVSAVCGVWTQHQTGENTELHFTVCVCVCVCVCADSSNWTFLVCVFIFICMKEYVLRFCEDTQKTHYWILSAIIFNNRSHMLDYRVWSISHFDFFLVIQRVYSHNFI